MLNAASTIFTMDIFKRFLKKDATEHQQVLMGRVCVPVAVVLGCLIAPIFANPDFGGAFNAIQSLQTYLSPGILTIFLFGLFVPARRGSRASWASCSAPSSPSPTPRSRAPATSPTTR
jgi:SSS family solute:Na+ symporter